MLGVAAGAQFGLTPTLMKGMTGAFSQGLGALFTSWQPYGMVTSGLLGMFFLLRPMAVGR